MSVEELHPPGVVQPRMLLLRMPVRSYSIDEVVLADADEVATFAIQKRRDEHLSGRWLLGQAVEAWGLESTGLMVHRTEHRAPYLRHIPGLWRNTPLPSISIGHAAGWAYVALIEHGWRIGIDAESANRGLQENAFNMMSKGEELLALQSAPSHAIELWVAKESVQKALGLGMHLNPRDIEIPIGVSYANLSIGNSKLQLVNWVYDSMQVSLAW
ncbi:MAG: 4'-phosphopantetheinyl transferase superfamily protein, partial [Candidatus Poseidoniaceae archaeon]|nr:4'-phosphopantetheinyl transferase superfamily protein [Candidatus Poseidoniaceae archaeon]